MLRALAAALCALSLVAAGTAAADWIEEDVKKVQDAVKQGRKVVQHETAPQVQIITLGVDIGQRSLEYVIDLRAQLCFVRGKGVPVTERGIPSVSASPVPCANLKKGYPVIAPLITWEP